VNPNLPVSRLRTMQDVYDGSLTRTTFTLGLLATASGVALLLGVIGLYGVLAYAVLRRRGRSRSGSRSARSSTP